MGGESEQFVTVTLQGSNDVPVFESGPRAETVTEWADGSTNEASDAPHGLVGSISFADPDPADNHTVSAAALGTGYHGDFAVAIDGTGHFFDWNFAVPDSDLDFLWPGRTLVQTYQVTLSDGHAGTAEQLIRVTLEDAADGPAPSAANDAVLTNVALGGAIAIPEWALMQSDDSGGGPRQIRAVSGPVGGDVGPFAPTATDDVVIFTDTSPAGGSFSYELTSPGGTDAAGVTITSFAGSSISGTGAGEILIGGGGVDLITCGGGNDTAIGGAGNDTNNDTLGTATAADAGAGDDQITVLTNGTMSGSVDGGLGSDTLNVSAGGDLTALSLSGIETLQTGGITAIARIAQLKAFDSIWFSSSSQSFAGGFTLADGGAIDLTDETVGRAVQVTAAAAGNAIVTGAGKTL